MSEPPPTPRAEAPYFPGPGHLDRALDLVRFLRARCSWDAKQTHESLVPHLLEETHEVVDAIHEGDHRALEGELGDLLLNLAFQIVLAEEEASFTVADVYAGLEAKMVRRHPHLFGGGDRRGWEELKAEERRDRRSPHPDGHTSEGGPVEGTLTGLASGLDPLTKAHRIQERVAGVGFDWDDHRGAVAKVREELAEVEAAADRGNDQEVAEELGDLLFAVVNAARLLGTHPTTVLEAANRKFVRRFAALEEMAHARAIRVDGASLETLENLWQAAKAAEREG